MFLKLKQKVREFKAIKETISNIGIANKPRLLSIINIYEPTNQEFYDVGEETNTGGININGRLKLVKRRGFKK